MTDFAKRFVSARRAAIAQYYSKLNREQREGVLTTEGALLLLAGAGSGKTTVLINRVANILTFGRGSDCNFVPEDATEDDLAFLEQYRLGDDDARMHRLCAVDVPRPWEILAVTFTNKAANELRERLEKFGIVGSADVWAMTFHSACVRMLRQFIDRIGFSKDFTIYDTDDSKRVIKDILKEMALDEKAFSPREVLSVISNAKDEMVDAAEFAKQWAHSGDWRRERIASIYARYTNALCKANALDFDDIILHTVHLLEQDEEMRAYYRRKFRYILVDEYQDTNHMQYKLVHLLAGANGNICVVGDDDQSIYRFRGADVSNILNFEKEFSHTRTIRLEQNYRSTQNILDCANAVIKNNSGRKGKTLWTDHGAGEKVQIKTVFNEAEEANFVVSSIISDCNRGRNWRDNAILYRMNAQSNALEYAFKRNGVPYQIVGGMKFFERAEVKDMLSYLAVINNPSDDLRLRRIINTPPRGISPATVEQLSEAARENNASVMDVMRAADRISTLRTAAVNRVTAFVQMIEDLRKAAETMPLADFYDLVCDKSGYTRALAEKNDMESRGRLENVEELKSNIAAFLQNDPEDATLSGFLNEVALYTDLDSTTDDNCVTLMTMHSAKGLEYPCVYVVGMEEGIFPGQRTMGDEAELEEERRICYVAMTRAREKLTMTNARQHMLFGRTTPNAPSRFLEEVPSDQSEWTDKGNTFTGVGGAEDYGDHFGGGWSGTPRTSAVKTSYGSTASHRASATPRRMPSGTTQTASPSLSLCAGDRVRHKAFGEGMVTAVTPMGGDALLEVAFDDVGTKKLMLKTASAHLEKI